MNHSGINLHQAYLQETTALGYGGDDAQLMVVQEFQRLVGELELQNAYSNGLEGIFRRWFGLAPRVSPKGIYLWGGVGRGKTFLMDLFYTQIPHVRRQRVHFHRFMLSIHRQLHQLKSESDPLECIADSISETFDILCFDELYVADITDAMVLAGLFHGLISRGVVLVFTSNTEVSELYRDGLQRERFMPAIELLKRHCVVHHIGGDIDYRLRTLVSARTYLAPHDDAAERQLSRLFARLAGDEPVSEEALSILGREVRVRRVSEGVCWFDFCQICEGPRSKADYAELSRFFHTLIISNIPVLGIEDNDPARRFVELVDELYDRRVNVVVSAATGPENLYGGVSLRHGFVRTASRLREFGSADYMALPHRP